MNDANPMTNMTEDELKTLISEARFASPSEYVGSDADITRKLLASEGKIQLVDDCALQSVWYSEATKITTISRFVNFYKTLIDGRYVHTPDTINNAIAALMLAANSLAYQDQAFRSGSSTVRTGKVMWNVIRKMIGGTPGPMRLIDFTDMLNPQYGQAFNTIPREVFKSLQNMAKKKLESLEANGDEELTDHLQSIISGNVPFGYTIE